MEQPTVNHEQALKKSIQHWWAMYKLSPFELEEESTKPGSKHTPYAENCECCVQADYTKNHACSRCAIFAYTGCYNCHSTPYYSARGAYYAVLQLARKLSGWDCDKYTYRSKADVERELAYKTAAWKALAREEIRFLITVLRKETNREKKVKGRKA